MRRNKFWLVLIKTMSGITNYVILALLLFCLMLGSYALLDTAMVNEETNTTEFAAYRPSEDDSLTFEDFKKINEDTIGWLDVYGTNVNYPIVQGDDNKFYIDHSAKGSYSGAGAIFLDYRNDPKFTDFNSIVYGHHMAEHAMFGDLDEFKDRNYFDTHEYGSLYIDQKEGQQQYGLEFVGFIEAGAYDGNMYDLDVKGRGEESAYIQYLKDHSIYWRDSVSVGGDDHLVLLYTCTEDLTNGRHLLVGKIIDQVPENVYLEDEDTGFHVSAYSIVRQILQAPLLWSIGLLVVLLLIKWVYERYLAVKRRKLEGR